MSNGGEEVLQLPVIVEAAESSPVAAGAAAQQIRKFLSRDWAQKPHVQYNAIMLVRILSDNPGATFTRNFDKSFVSTVKELLRNSKDHSTQQILRETLDSLEVNKQHDEGCQALLQMWRKEKGQQASLSHSQSQRTAPSRPPNGQQWQPPPGQYQNVYNNGQPPAQAQQPAFASRGSRHTLPAPFELASRIEEARNTAKILLQLIQSTPTEEVLQNELLREFSERCQSAQRSMQTYINCDNPSPDHDTMQTLIETNEQLSLAGSRYQRAMLAARRTMDATPSPNPEAQPGTGYFQDQATANQRNSLLPPSHSSQPQTNGFGYQQPQTDGNGSYLPSPGPPQSGSNSLQYRDQRQSQFLPVNEQHQALSHIDGHGQPSNPFLDPIEHDNNAAPLAIEPTNYTALPPKAASHRQQPSQTFSIDAEPSYAPSQEAQDRRNTVDLENAYSASVTPVSQPSPTMTRARPDTASTGFGSPHSPQRPGPGPWHTSGVSPSYMHRQSSALNGLTMHGAQSDDNVAEIDTHSDVGRNETSPTSAATASSYTDSPVLTTARQARRVDVAGTGGFRGV